jgi:hypothetical protein
MSPFRFLFSIFLAKIVISEQVKFHIALLEKRDFDTTPLTNKSLFYSSSMKTDNRNFEIASLENRSFNKLNDVLLIQRNRVNKEQIS